MIMEPLININMEFVLLTLFIIITTVLTLVEGIYKSSSLLFNCKDDDMLLSLPIKKSTILFVRLFKFYIFELMYNSIFLIPAMIVYITYVKVGVTFYLSSIIALLLLPIIPIVISCIVGAIISGASSKFKLKNLSQIIITTLFLLVIFYISFNLQGIIQNLAQNASSVNDLITKIYYTAGAYIKLITNFRIQDLLVFICIHLAIFIAAIFVLGKVYFRINSTVKKIKVASKNSGNYIIKTNKPIIALIKKELKKFISSPVFVINAGFGLVLFLVASIGISIKIASISAMLAESEINISAEQIMQYIPIVTFGLICFASLLTCITCSMISLEGKTFNILKSLPVQPFKIILAKVLTAVLIMVPFILIGDIVMFIKFSFSIEQILMLLFASILLPLASETLGILVNLKYPKMDAENDTEVVKQSMSSFVSVFSGMILTGLTIYGLVKLIKYNIDMDLIILYGIAFYLVMFIALLLILKYRSVKQFNKINV